MKNYASILHYYTGKKDTLHESTRFVLLGFVKTSILPTEGSKRKDKRLTYPEGFRRLLESDVRVE